MSVVLNLKKLCYGVAMYVVLESQGVGMCKCSAMVGSRVGSLL